ncbi:MAG: hypothetical protein AAGE98_15535 [Actinomycetota bacterium]
MSDLVELSGRLGAMTNLVHGFIYFAPEASEEYDALGLPSSHHYFASRGAALGPAPHGVVVATFYNFNPDLSAFAIPDAWSIAEPAAIQAARMRAAGRVLRRVTPDVTDDDVAEATEIAGRMIAGVGDAGRPLAAGNRATPEPDDPWERLWQRITVIREWRGDAHVAALVSAPADPVEALILHAATGQVSRKALFASRAWPEEAWAAGVQRLVARGLVNDDESFTEMGEAFRADIERRTDVASMPLVDAVGPDQTMRLIELLKPVRRALLDGGAFDAMRR